MNTKLLTGAGCLLVLVAAAAPSVFGHEQNPYNYTNDDPNGNSGRFVGAAGPAIVEDETVPQDTIATGAILCDMEVAGDGTMPFPQDEAHVDGYTGAFPNNQAPDTVDDGGLGGSCHTDSYDFDDYNTPGCPDAFAGAAETSDPQGALGETWIGASCDWGFVDGGTPASDIFVTCVVNAILTGHPEYIISGANPPPPQNGCVQDFLDCLLSVTPDACTEDGTFACGSDGSSDGINFGHGLDADEAAYPSAAAAASNCPTATTSAAIFVWESISNVGDIFPIGPGDGCDPEAPGFPQPECNIPTPPTGIPPGFHVHAVVSGETFQR